MKKITLALFLEFALAFAWSRGIAAQGMTYSTSFPLTESSISESGHWIDGQTVGLDWGNVVTTPGRAFGADGSGNFADPTAILTGTWGADQSVEATVFSLNQNSAYYEEVEVRLRSAITAHSNTGYEINFRCTHDGSQYVQIVRWNGPLGNFTYVTEAKGPGIKNGDVVKATIVGSVITAYINGVQVAQGTDTTFTHGNPGMGFYFQGIGTANRDYGFTSLTATSGATAVPSAPKNLRIIG